MANWSCVLTSIKKDAILLSMPWQRPDFFEGGVYHIYNRGAGKLPTYIDDEDYQSFEDILRYLLVGIPIFKKAQSGEAKPHIPVTYKADPRSNGLFRQLLCLVSYTLMPNHFHLIIQIVQPHGQLEVGGGRMRSFQSIPEFMRRLCITYCQKFNYRHHRQGLLYQGRYQSKLVPTDDYVVQVNRYLHLNPVAAGLVQQPEDWKWSDYHKVWCGQLTQDKNFTIPDLIMSYFSGNKGAYREFVHGGMEIDEAARISKFAIDLAES